MTFTPETSWRSLNFSLAWHNAIFEDRRKSRESGRDCSERRDWVYRVAAYAYSQLPENRSDPHAYARVLAQLHSGAESLLGKKGVVRVILSHQTGKVKRWFRDHRDEVTT